MKKLLILLIVITSFAACNDAVRSVNDCNCETISKDSLSPDHKEYLLANGWDSTKCYSIVP